MRARTAHPGEEAAPIVAVVAVLFFGWGVVAERIASVWPEGAGSRRALGPRAVAIGACAAVAAAGIASRSSLPGWATATYLAFLAVFVALAATDLEQRLLPHALLDPLIIGALAFVPFNPAVSWQSALAGAAIGVAFLGILGLVMRGGIAAGDLYLVAPLGLVLGLSAAFTALLVAGVLAGAVSGALLLTRRAQLGSYIPFGPFLVAGALFSLLTGPELTAATRALLPIALP
ncbi:MAG: A24 family peptidase [Candidatus Limnocylindria bacterium]